MKELLIAEMKRVLELFEKIEEGEKRYKKLQEENEEREAKAKAEGKTYYHYISDTTSNNRAELKQMLKMFRKHSVEWEKQEKSWFNR